MATIDELNFKLIVDDSDFTAQIRKDMEAAEKLNMTLTQYLNLKVRYNNAIAKEANAKSNANTGLLKEKEALEKVNGQIQKNIDLQAQRNAMTQARVSTENQKAAYWEEKRAKLSEQTTNQYKRQSAIMSQLTSYAASYFSVYGAVSLVNNMTRISAEFEKQRVSLRAILKDANGADALFEQIKGLAVESPFQFKELVSYAKQLSAYSIPLNELYDTTKMLADVSAGLGVGMDRLVLAYGQIRSASFLRGQEVRQLTEAGIPILSELAKQFEVIEGRAVSAGEVFDKISARLVPFEMVQKVFKDMTSDGGKFFNMQEVQAETLAGKLSNLQDAYEIMFAEIGESGFNDFMADIVDSLRGMIDNYRRVGEQIAAFVVSLGIARTAIALYTGAVALANGSQTILQKGFQNILKFVDKNPYVLLATGVAVLSTVIYSAATSMTTFEKEMRAVEKANLGFNSAVKAETETLDYLFGKLNKATEGTEEYEIAKRNILSTYSQYLSSLDAESLKVENQIDTYDRLRQAIIDANKEKYFQEGSTGIKDLYQSEIQGINKDLEDIFKKRKIDNEKVKKELADLIYGRVSTLADISREAREAYGSAMASQPQFNGMYTTQTYNELDLLRTRYQRAAEAFSTSMASLTNSMAYMYGESGKKAEEVIEGTARRIQDIFKKFGVNQESQAFGLWYGNMTDYYEYIDDLKKKYDELGEKIKKAGSAMKDQIPAYEKQREIIRAIAGELGISDILNGGTNTTSTTPNTSKKSPAQVAIESQIKVLQELKKAHDQLSQYADQNNVQAFLEQLYPHIDKSVIERLDFDTELARLAEELRKYDEDAANAALNSLGNKALSELVNKLKSVNEWRDFIDSFIPTSETEGEGMRFEISNIVKEYKDRLKQIEDAKRKAREKFKMTAAIGQGYIDEKQLAREYGIISEDFVKQENNALNKATNDVAKSAEKWAKWWLETEKGFDLENFSDKSINELKRLKDAIADFADSDLPEGIKASLNELGIPLDEFIGKFEEGLDSWNKKAKEATKDKIIKGLIKDAKYVGELADSVQALGEASGNAGLADLGIALGAIADLVTNALQGFAAGGWIGAAVAAVSTIGGMIVDAISQTEVLKNAIIEAQAQALVVNSNLRLSEGVDTIFGDNAVKNISNAVEEMRKLGIQTSISARQAQSYAITWKSGFLSLGRTSKQIEDTIREMGYELFDEYGNLNENGLQAILNTYGKLTPESRKWVEKALADTQMYRKAIEQLESAIEVVFGNLSDDIADQMINGYLEVGDATRDLADYMGETFSSLAQDIAREMVSSFVLDNILSKYEDEVKNLYNMMAGDASPESIATAFGRIAKSITADSEAAAEFTNMLMDALEQAGVNFREGGRGMSAAISNITESQADLLASYINAIRADVSYNKVNIESLTNELRQLVTMLYVTPTLNDYMMQIQANTYDSAESNREILDRIDSMLTTETGQSALRVVM